MPLRTALTERLGIRHPVLSAPMGSSAGGALAGGVSAAGGLGLIGGGLGNREWLEREFKLAGNQRVGVGFITWGLASRPELLDMALDHRPAAFMLSFGDAAPFLPRVKRAGIPAICQIQTLEQARTVLAEGADIVIAQGAEGTAAAVARFPSSRPWRTPLRRRALGRSWWRQGGSPMAAGWRRR